MQIIVTPSDIIQRCLWAKYRKYCIHNISDDDLELIITENKPRVITEEEAFVIGLLKIIETDNLVHSFNEFILDILQHKSSVIKDELYINKKSVMKEISYFMCNFPDSYKASFNYMTAIDELKKYIDELESTVDQLEVLITKNNDKTITFINSKSVRKCLKS